MSDPLLHLRRRYPCDLVPDNRDVIVRASGSGKEVRIENAGELPNIIKAFRDAYEGMLAEIADQESKTAA